MALPALGQGVFATTSIPSSIVIRRALLKPPSILSILQTEAPFFVRRNYVTQFSDIKAHAPLEELLLLIHQESAVGVLKEQIFADRLAFSAMSEGCFLTFREGCSPRHENERFLDVVVGILRFLPRFRAVPPANRARIAFWFAWKAIMTKFGLGSTTACLHYQDPKVRRLGN